MWACGLLEYQSEITSRYPILLEATATAKLDGSLVRCLTGFSKGLRSDLLLRLLLLLLLLLLLVLLLLLLMLQLLLLPLMLLRLRRLLHRLLLLRY